MPLFSTRGEYLILSIRQFYACLSNDNKVYTGYRLCVSQFTFQYKYTWNKLENYTLFGSEYNNFLLFLTVGLINIFVCRVDVSLNANNYKN